MDKVFKVTLFGLAPNEHNTLGSIFKLAASRNRKYAVVGEAERGSAEIAIVDADDPKAIEAWKAFSVHSAKIPFVRVTKATTPAPPDAFIIRRPMTLKRVLDVLDEVTIKVFNFVPENKVGGEGELDEESKKALDTALKSVESKAKTGIKALVVDDSEMVRKSMGLQLGLFGLQIDYAEDGESALEMTKKTTDYDIVFLDIMMPGIDGYKVCKTLRADKYFKNTPIIMLTGKDSRFDKLKGTMAGASLYLTKPVEKSLLDEVIQKFLPQLAGK